MDIWGSVTAPDAACPGSANTDGEEIAPEAVGATFALTGLFINVICNEEFAEEGEAGAAGRVGVDETLNKGTCLLAESPAIAADFLRFMSVSS